LRNFSDTDAKMLPGTETAALPFWSPDSKSVAFFAKGKLQKIDLDSTRATTIAENVDGRGGTWSRSGTILFAPSSTSGLARVAATGGEPIAVTRLGGDQQSHRFPWFLPDGDHFLYYVQGTHRGIYIATLDGKLNRRLTDSGNGGVFAQTGY